MGDLRLSVAVGDYDRMRPLFDNEVQIDGVDPVFMRLSPEEIFFRAFRHAEFDVCELSLSSFTVRTARGDNPYVGIPVYPSRAFRHTSIVIRTDRGIASPADLRGRRIGTCLVPAYRGASGRAGTAGGRLMQVRRGDVTWVRGGLGTAGIGREDRAVAAAGDNAGDAPADTTLSAMLEGGQEIDGIVAPRARPPRSSGSDPFRLCLAVRRSGRGGGGALRRTRIFPIMHVLGLRRSIAEQHPWLPGALG